MTFSRRRFPYLDSKIFKWSLWTKVQWFKMLIQGAHFSEEIWFHLPKYPRDALRGLRAMEEFWKPLWTNFVRVMSVIRILMHEKSNRLIEKKKPFFFLYLHQITALVYESKNVMWLAVFCRQLSISPHRCRKFPCTGTISQWVKICKTHYITKPLRRNRIFFVF